MIEETLKPLNKKNKNPPLITFETPMVMTKLFEKKNY